MEDITAMSSADLQNAISLIGRLSTESLFTDMPWDEAYDRFEETWWVDEGSDAA